MIGFIWSVLFAATSTASLPPTPIRVCTVQGGGVKGLCPIVMLQYSEALVRQKNPQLSVYDLFDRFSGVSAGSAIAAALAVRKLNKTPLDWQQLTNHDTFRQQLQPVSCWKRLFCCGCADPVFDVDAYAGYLTGMLGQTKFGDLRQAGIQLSILSYNATEQTQLIFSTDDEGCDDVALVEAVLDSSAFPGAFAGRIVSLPGQKREVVCLDGGFVSKDMSLREFADAKRKGQKLYLTLFGTGDDMGDHSADKFVSGGLCCLACKTEEMTGALVNGPTEHTQMCLTDIAEADSNFTFYPFQPKTRAGTFDTSEEELTAISRGAAQYFADNMKRFSELVDALILLSPPQSIATNE